MNLRRLHRRFVVRIGLLLLLVATGGLPWQSEAASDFPAFEVQGNGIITVLSAEEKEIQKIEFDFLLGTSTRGWTLSVIRPRSTRPDGIAPMPEYFYSGDTSNRYALVREQPSSSAPTRRHVSILSSPYPDMWMYKYLWLVYSSGAYSDRVDPPQMLPPWDLQEWEKTDYFTLELSRSASPPFCPRVLTWTHPGYFLVGAKKQHADPPFNEGFLAGELKIDRHILLNDLELPATFTLSQYALMRAPGGGLRHGLNVTYSASIKSARESKLQSFRPEMTPGTIVRDARFANPELRIPYLQYTQASSIWPEATDPQLVAMYEALVGARQPPADNSGLPVNRSAALVLLAVVGVAPLLYLALTRTRRRNRVAQ